MTAPTQLLPPAAEIAELPKRSQIAYAIRCALRVEPLYADKAPDILRARFVSACIETAREYFDTGRFEDKAESIQYDHAGKDYGVQAAVFVREASYSAYCEENDPDYDPQDAENDESTPAHRVEHVAAFSLLAVYDVSGSLEESRRCERLALDLTIADFKYLLGKPSNVQLADMGPLWDLDSTETYNDKLKKHAALVAAPST